MAGLFVELGFEFGDQSPTARKLRGLWFRRWPRRAEQDAVREVQQRTGCPDPFLCLRFLRGHTRWVRFLAPSGRAASSRAARDLVGGGRAAQRESKRQRLLGRRHGERSRSQLLFIYVSS